MSERVGYTDARTAAKRLNMDYELLCLRLRQGRVPGAFKGYLNLDGWGPSSARRQQWLVPEWITKDNIRPKSAAKPELIEIEESRNLTFQRARCMPLRFVAALAGVRLWEDYLESIQAALPLLSTRERFIIERRFPLSGRQPATLGQLALEFDVSRERIRQIQLNAFNKIRDTVLEDVQERLTKTFEEVNTHTG